MPLLDTTDNADVLIGRNSPLVRASYQYMSTLFERQVCPSDDANDSTCTPYRCCYLSPCDILFKFKEDFKLTLSGTLI